MFIIIIEAKQVESNSVGYLWRKLKKMRKQNIKNLSSPFIHSFIHTQYVQKTGCKTAFSAWLLYVKLRWNKRQRLKGRGLFCHNSLGLFIKFSPIIDFGLLFQSNTRGFFYTGHSDPTSSLQSSQLFRRHCEALRSGAWKVQMSSAKTFEKQYWLWISLAKLHSAEQECVF